MTILTVIQYVSLGPVMWSATISLENNGKGENGFIMLLLMALAIVGLANIDLIISSLYFRFFSHYFSDLYIHPHFLILEMPASLTSASYLLLSLYHLHFVALLAYLLSEKINNTIKSQIVDRLPRAQDLL